MLIKNPTTISQGFPKLLIKVRDGLVESISFDGFDATTIRVFKADYDTDGSGPGDGVAQLSGVKCFFEELGLAEIDMEESRALRQAITIHDLTD